MRQIARGGQKKRYDHAQISMNSDLHINQAKIFLQNFELLGKKLHRDNAPRKDTRCP